MQECNNALKEKYILFSIQLEGYTHKCDSVLVLGAILTFQVLNLEHKLPKHYIAREDV